MADNAAVSRYADTIMAEIRHDIRTGQVPGSVGCWAELHDHVDANEYALQVIPQGQLEWDEWMQLANAVEGECDRRIRAGELLSVVLRQA
jgi:hypothetical protein